MASKQQASWGERDSCTVCDCKGCKCSKTCKCVKTCEPDPCTQPKCGFAHCTCGPKCTCGVSTEVNCDPCKVFKMAKMKAAKEAAEKEKAAAAAARVKVVLGSMEFGRYADEAAGGKMTQMFIDAGHREVDTAYMYAGGKSEKILGRMPASVQAEIAISTKVNPWGGKGLSKKSVLQQANTCLTRLQCDKVDIMYLHAPDHETPIEETLEAVHQLYSEGKFERLGVSNYSAWQVMEIWHICDKRGYIKPSVYQGMYNAITRGVEPELFPALRRLNMSFYAYNPLAGGILTGKHKYADAEAHAAKAEGGGVKGRFFGNSWAEAYRKRFWREENFVAVDRITSAVSAAYPDKTPTPTETALRWLMFHSQLKGQRGDGVILGASKIHHLEQNLAACAAGPLDASVVNAIEQAHASLTSKCPNYFR